MDLAKAFDLKMQYQNMQLQLLQKDGLDYVMQQKIWDLIIVCGYARINLAIKLKCNNDAKKNAYNLISYVV